MLYYQDRMDSIVGVVLSTKDNDTKLGELLDIRSELSTESPPKHNPGELIRILGAQDAILNIIDSLCNRL